MLINPAVIDSALALFSRPLSYIREGTTTEITAHALPIVPVDENVINDLDVNNWVVTASVKVLTAASLYPPKKYDKIVIDNVARNVESFKTIYIGANASLVKIWVTG